MLKVVEFSIQGRFSSTSMPFWGKIYNFGHPERRIARIQRLWDLPDAYCMAPHLFQCSKLSNSLYKADFLRLQCHSEVKYIILVIRSDVQLELNVFEIYLTLIAWHHIYFNAQSCGILYTPQNCLCFSVRCCGRLRISTARSEFIVCEHQSNYGTQEYLAS